MRNPAEDPAAQAQSPPQAAAPSAEPKSPQATAQPKRRQQPAQPKATGTVAPKPKQPAAKPQPTGSVGDELAALSDPLSDPMGDLLSETGLDGAATPEPAAGRTCPSCGVAMAPGAILCVACGFNQKSGKRVQTHRESDEAAEGGPLSAGRPRKKGGSKGAMNLVAVGLSLMYWAYIAIVGAGVIMVGCTVAATQSSAFALGLTVLPFIAILAMLVLIVWASACAWPCPGRRAPRG